MSCPIAWCSFSWEAFATLATGLTAVGAAVYIGRKQTEIQKKQADIQLQAIRADLFERRLENYETVRDLINSLLRNADEIDSGLEQRFFIAQREAQFLFNQKVNDGLSEIWNLCGELNAVALELRQNQISQGHAGVELPARKQAAFQALNAKYRELSSLYSEIRLDIETPSPAKH